MIEIYYPFTFLNEYINKERSNRYAAAKIKRDTTSAIRYMLLGKPKLKTPCRLNFTWLVLNQRMDLDNIAFAKKYVIDGMVSAGLIPDDGLKYIKGFTDKYEISNKIGVRITHEEIINEK